MLHCNVLTICHHLLVAYLHSLFLVVETWLLPLFHCIAAFKLISSMWFNSVPVSTSRFAGCILYNFCCCVKFNLIAACCCCVVAVSWLLQQLYIVRFGCCLLVSRWLHLARSDNLHIVGCCLVTACVHFVVACLYLVVAMSLFTRCLWSLGYCLLTLGCCLFVVSCYLFLN